MYHQLEQYSDVYIQNNGSFEVETKNIIVSVIDGKSQSVWCNIAIGNAYVFYYMALAWDRKYQVVRTMKK